MFYEIGLFSICKVYRTVRLNVKRTLIIYVYLLLYENNEICIDCKIAIRHTI